MLRKVRYVSDATRSIQELSMDPLACGVVIALIVGAWDIDGL